MPPPEPSPPPGGLQRALARAGVVGAAFAVFLCGWLAMKTDDWRLILLYTGLAFGAGALATAFSRLGR